MSMASCMGTEVEWALQVCAEGPRESPLVAAAPLLCAGITTYSPMKHYGLDKKGMKLAVVGLGGLGHMAVKFGKGETPFPHCIWEWLLLRQATLVIMLRLQAVEIMHSCDC